MKNVSTLLHRHAFMKHPVIHHKTKTGTCAYSGRLYGLFPAPSFLTSTSIFLAFAGGGSGGVGGGCLHAEDLDEWHGCLSVSSLFLSLAVVHTAILTSHVSACICVRVCLRTCVLCALFLTFRVAGLA